MEHEITAANGSQNQQPPRNTILVKIDLEKKEVSMTFDNRDFPNWDYVLAILGMAERQAETIKQEVVVQARMQKMAEMQQAQQIHSKVIRGR